MAGKSRTDSNGLPRQSIQYSRHFRAMLKERDIPMTFVKIALAEPEKTEERNDGTKHFLRRIKEYNNRWLRVVVNVTASPNKAVTVFFDRRLSG
jgi:hypothetical protein